MESRETVDMLPLLPAYHPNSSHHSNTSVDILRNGCFNQFSTVACIRSENHFDTPYSDFPVVQFSLRLPFHTLFWILICHFNHLLLFAGEMCLLNQYMLCNFNKFCITILLIILQKWCYINISHLDCIIVCGQDYQTACEAPSNSSSIYHLLLCCTGM